jgi:HAD superfamily hydrolase (TIGR01509 family)
MSFMIRALVFDFDGLILETELPIFQSWQELFQAHGLDLPFELWAHNIGTAEEPFNPVSELQQHVGAGFDLGQEFVDRRERELELIGDTPPMPGVLEYLQDARRMGLKIGVASSSSCGWVEGHLERLRIRDYFDCIRAKDDVPLTKPDPALYRMAVESLGVRPEEALAFEDSRNGILSAKRAGLYCVAVPNALTRLTDTSQADLTLNSLTDMPLADLIAKIERLAH